MARSEAEASELTAVRQVVMKTNYKLGNLQQQFDGLQESMNRVEALLQRLVYSQARTLDQITGRCAPKLRPTEEPRTLPDLNQPAELEKEMTRRIEDLRQIVATGWEQDLLPDLTPARAALPLRRTPVGHGSRLQLRLLSDLGPSVKCVSV